MNRIRIDADDLERIAFHHGLPVERSAAEERMYVTCDGITFWAPSPSIVEVTC